jgi:hypothetical protein
MARFIDNTAIRAIVTISCVLLLSYTNSLALAQSFPPNFPQAPSQTGPPQLLAPEQLNNLVAPIALYPDSLLGQALAACTYPLEIVEAQQWLQQNRNLPGQSLIEAAKRQNWDPSVQVLVAFPDAMALFSRDIRWTTDLGDAFLAQPADVMNAIQRMRAQASNNGRLATTPQQIVTTETQDEQSAIRIEPANPQVLYPPVYNPAYVWGPPASGAYPALSYPQGDYGSGGGGGYGPGGDYGSADAYGPGGGYGTGGGFGSGFGNAINLAGLFSGLLGWGGWGWALNWFTHTLSLNSLFFNGFGSRNFTDGFNSAGGFGAPADWAHNPAHRLGVPYAHRFLADRYRGANPGAHFGSPRPAGSSFSTSGFAPVGFAAAGRSASDGWRHFGGGNSAFAPSPWAGRQGFEPGNQMAENYSRAGPPSYRSGFASNNGRSPQDYRSYSTAMPQRIGSNFRGAAPSPRAPAPVSHFSAPWTSSQRFSPPASSPSQHSFAPRASSPRMSSPHFSAPRGSSHVSAPRRSGGGHSGKGSRRH